MPRSADKQGLGVKILRMGSEPVRSYPSSRLVFLQTENMQKSISVNKKSRPGRPKKAVAVEPVSAVRLPADLTGQVDAWGESRHLSRSEAIRLLVEIGLSKSPTTKRSRAARETVLARAAKAKELAAAQIDRVVDKSAPAKEQASRKGRLLKGPEEFRQVRVDGAKGT